MLPFIGADVCCSKWIVMVNATHVFDVIFLNSKTEKNNFCTIFLFSLYICVFGTMIVGVEVDTLIIFLFEIAQTHIRISVIVVFFFILLFSVRFLGIFSYSILFFNLRFFFSFSFISREIFFDFFSILSLLDLEQLFLQDHNSHIDFRIENLCSGTRQIFLCRFFGQPNTIIYNLLSQVLQDYTVLQTFFGNNHTH